MRRRSFITLLGGAAAAWPLAARAQQVERMRRVGVLTGYAESDRIGQARIGSFRERLQELGWVGDRNVRIEYRWATDNATRIRDQAAELINAAPDVIVAQGIEGLAALQQQTREIPVVFVTISDPVDSGLVKSLSRPGGNFTGFTYFEFSMGGKWIELLKDIAPQTKRAAIILNPAKATSSVGYLRAIESVGPSLGIDLTTAGVHDAEGIESTFKAFANGSTDGLIVLADTTTVLHRAQIITLAARHRLPAVYAFRYFVTDGGLISYGADPIDMYRRAASYVDHILRGERPADLPVQQPTKFHLVVNLKTAKTLGLSVPPTLLARADEVIE